jgi:hypothetical protein
MGLTGVMFVDVFYLHTGFIQEGPPKLSLGWLLRSTSILLSLIVITISFLSGRRWRDVCPQFQTFSLERLSVLGMFFIGGIILLVFLYRPDIFSSISRENNLIEAASAIFLLCSSATVIMATVSSRAQACVPTITRVALVMLALVFFVIGMEEISWGQQIFDFKTPAVFSGNAQGELNFHNFATNRVENVSYFFAFIFLVILPFLGVLFPSSVRDRRIYLLFPRPFIILLGAISCAYNFDMWNVLPIQVSFFASLIVLSLLVSFSINWNERVVVLLMLMLLVATQVIFLINGDNFERPWEVTEYKELLISLAFLTYSVSVYLNITRFAAQPQAHHY